MKLIQMQPPRLRGAFELSPNAAYHYLVPHVAKAIEWAYYWTITQHGAGPQTPVIFDCADRNGHTPAGRHPGGAHDGGINLDVSYYRFQPAFDIGPVGGNRLVGKPTNLDAIRQAAWFLALGRLEATFGGQNLIRMIAVDPLAEAPIDAAIARAGANDDAEREALRLCFSSQGGGWQIFHHNHAHARFQAVSDANSAELADYIEAKFIAPLLVVPVKPVLLAEQPDHGDEADPLPEAA